MNELPVVAKSLSNLSLVESKKPKLKVGARLKLIDDKGNELDAKFMGQFADEIVVRIGGKSGRSKLIESLKRLKTIERVILGAGFLGYLKSKF